MIEIQRRAAAALLAVVRGRSLTQALSEQLAAPLSAQQRAAMQDLAYGSCRWLGRLRALLGELVHQPLSDPQVEALLLIALYQLQWTRAKPYAVVDFAVRTCEALGYPAAKGLVNAVLRNYLRSRGALLEHIDADPVARYSYPAWWIEVVGHAWPAEHDAILRTGNLHPPFTLRVNRRALSARDYLAELAAAGLGAQALGGDAVRVEPPVPVERLPGFERGWVSVQDLAAQHAAPLLDLKPGQRVLDACAAPGGKTGHLLEACDMSLLALDRDPVRLERLRQTLARLRLEARVELADAARPEHWWDGTPFDRILLDAPCTASGVVRRHPDIKWLRRPDDVPRLVAEQARLLGALWRTLAPGGTLLYVTCSVFPAENQQQIAGFLRAHHDAYPVPLPQLSASGGQLLPSPHHDGFFYAALQKRPVS
jgi:16S rRNA (cytosine967-C5)-methyltransferase